MLFNLNEDPYEQANQAQNNEFRDKRKKLVERLRLCVSDTGTVSRFRPSKLLVRRLAGCERTCNTVPIEDEIYC
jgi:hypothetical protein